MTANPNRNRVLGTCFSCRLRFKFVARESSTAHRSTRWNAASAAAAAVWFGTRDLLGCFLWILIRAVEMITVFILRFFFAFDQHSAVKHLLFDCWSLFFCFDTFLASYLWLDSVFCNLGESACVYLLVWFLPFVVGFYLTFCGYFHCWVVIIFCIRSHTQSHLHRPS